jgi:hypothetical protein
MEDTIDKIKNGKGKDTFNFLNNILSLCFIFKTSLRLRVRFRHIIDGRNRSLYFNSSIENSEDNDTPYASIESLVDKK